MIVGILDDFEHGKDDAFASSRGLTTGTSSMPQLNYTASELKVAMTTNCSSRVVSPENTVLDAQNTGRVLELNASGDFVVDGVTLRG